MSDPSAHPQMFYSTLSYNTQWALQKWCISIAPHSQRHVVSDGLRVRTSCFNTINSHWNLRSSHHAWAVDFIIIWQCAVIFSTSENSKHLKKNQRLEDGKTRALCCCFTLENNQQLLVTPNNLSSVGVKALTHVTDIADLIWLVITPSYSFRAVHTSELQFQVLNQEREIQLCLWKITPLHRRPYFFLCCCHYDCDYMNVIAIKIGSKLGFITMCQFTFS